MKYLEYINLKIREAIKNKPVICIGQNLDSGSFIGGLTRGLEVGPGGKILNATCAENTLVGLGFGIALNGGHAVLFMKQLDFLLLGIDQVVNTWNAIRNRKPEHKITGSFSIIPVVIDSGFQGPQSSLNALDAIGSVGRCSAWNLNAKQDIDFILDKLLDPGFRIIALSHKLCNTELIEELGILEECSPYVQYNFYDVFPHVVIVSTGFTLPSAFELVNHLSADHGMSSVIIQIPSATGPTSNRCHDAAHEIRHFMNQCNKLVILDDSKAEISAGDKVLSDLFRFGFERNVDVEFLKHEMRDEPYEMSLGIVNDSPGWDLKRIARIANAH